MAAEISNQEGNGMANHHNQDIRIKVTEQQKKIISEACELSGTMLGTKARELLVKWACTIRKEAV